MNNGKKMHNITRAHTTTCYYVLKKNTYVFNMRDPYDDLVILLQELILINKHHTLLYE